MSKLKLAGLIAAPFTPFDENGEVNYAMIEKQAASLIADGVKGAYVCGTTGENATLSEEEHQELVRFTVRECRGRMTVVAGIGSNNTRHALRNAENAKAVGADGILMVTPYYNKTTQQGLVEHFGYVADRVDIPMILYNVPSRTGIGISADTYRILSQHPNINGIKEASGDFSLIAAVRSQCGDDLFLWSGNDDNTVAMMSLGALGVISVASNIVPGVTAKICSLCLDGSYKEATELFGRYAALFSALFIETNPIPVKAAMRLLDMDSGLLRLPLTEIGEEHLQTLRSVMRESGLNV